MRRLGCATRRRCCFPSSRRSASKTCSLQASKSMLKSYGCGSKINHQELDPRFLSWVPFARVLPGFHFGYPFLTHSHIDTHKTSHENMREEWEPTMSSQNPQLSCPVRKIELGQHGLPTCFLQPLQNHPTGSSQKRHGALRGLSWALAGIAPLPLSPTKGCMKTVARLL